MRNKTLLLTSFLLAQPAAWAQQSDMSRQMEAVMIRLEQLETENRDLKSRLDRIEPTPSAPTAGDEVEVIRRETEAGTVRSTAVEAAPSAFDTHVEASLTPPPQRVRVFGHLGVNTWAGEANVPARAGENQTTNVWDASLGVEARVGENTDLKFRPVTLMPALTGDADGFSGGDYMYLRDAYLSFRDLIPGMLGVRFGRMPYAFGDEYLQFDAPDNPLVSHSVAFGWGYDEGLALFGKLTDEISYIGTLYVDSSLGNGADDSISKGKGLKLMGDHGPWHWSTSYFDAGESTQHEFWLGRRPIDPVGATGSPGRASPSTSVGAAFYEGDLAYRWSQGYLALAMGGGMQDDRSELHDRTFDWYKVESVHHFRPNWYVAGRYSGIGVEDPTQGYQFRNFEDDSAESAGVTLNADINSLQKASVGLGYELSEWTTIKLEHSVSDYQLIPNPITNPPGAAGSTTSPEKRSYTVLQAVAKY